MMQSSFIHKFILYLSSHLCMCNICFQRMINCLQNSYNYEQTNFTQFSLPNHWTFVKFVMKHDLLSIKKFIYVHHLFSTFIYFEQSGMLNGLKYHFICYLFGNNYKLFIQGSKLSYSFHNIFQTLENGIHHTFLILD
jgi:hypothetical protein